MRKILFISIFLFNIAYAHPPKDKLKVFALSAKALESNKARIKTKEELILRVYNKLLKDADKALEFGPVSVMEKKNIPPSGDKHDYMSLAPYFWPDSSKPNGVPYLRRDGVTNPEVKDYKDKEYMPKLCEVVHTLALAYYFSEEKAYAKHAARLLRVWFLDTATRMNPNLNFAQAIKGVNNGRGAGLIDTRHFIKVVDAVGILAASKYMEEKDVAGMKKWFSDFLNWMQTSPNGLDEMATKNNHGAWYDAQRLSFALFVDSLDLAKRIVANAENRLDKQMDDNGDFPKEMERTTSFHYTIFAVDAFLNIAQMAETINIDFWNYKSPSGKSLKKAFDRLFPYITQRREWEGQQIKTFDFEETYLLLAQASKHFNCKSCMGEIKAHAGDSWYSLRLHLFYNNSI